MLRTGKFCLPRGRAAAVVLAGCLLFAPFFAPSARADAPDPQKASAAQALFDQASDEMDARNYKAACPRLEESVKLIPEALGARMKLAECFEGLGKLASAWTQYAMVEGLATKSGDSGRAEKAGKKAAALKPRLATLTLELASGVDSLAGLAITRDGVEISKGQAGVKLPVDVGSHDIVVSASGYKTWKKTIEVLADGANTTTKVPMLVADAGGGQAGGAAEGGRPWQMPLGIAGLAVGGASVVVGSVLGGLAITKFDESNAGPCDATNQCTPQGINMRNQALAMGDASTALIVIGGALAVGGIVLVVLPNGGAATKKAGAEKVRWGVAPALGGLQVRGSF